jgi:DNA-binding CsgD family transcriptional regulator
MRGRGAEYETVLGLLDGTQQGQGRMLLVEGEPGTGKSLLLARAGEEAGRRGFRVVAAAAGELSPAPSLDGLEELASAGPVLVTVDNVQWADLATTQALRSMPRLLGSYPLSWILAVGTSSDAGPAELLFGLLESGGAARISLGPLDHEDQIALIGDVLGAVPDQTLIELAADAAGNPLVLAEAFGGLRDENAIVVHDGHASLARAQVSSVQVSSVQVTSRIETLARDRLKGLSARARRFVATASILGGSFRLEDVGEMLGESPGALLAALDEALSAYLLVVRADSLAFRHEFVRQAVARMLAEPVQQALHWQYGRMLLARGGSAVPAAYHLLRGARPGDAEALAGLDRAVAEIAPFAPQAAAELATGALVLTLPSDPGRSVRTAAAARALTAAGQWDEAETLVRSALAAPRPAREAAAMRCALASLLALTGRAMEAMTEAQTVLTNSGVPADLRDQATVALMWAWLGLRGNQQADQLAGTILAEPSTKPGELVVAAMVALAVARWDSGRAAEALDLAAQAVRQATDRPYETTHFSPHIFLASALIQVRRLDEATVITDAFEVGGPRPEGITEVLRARIGLAAGRLDDAVALAESASRRVKADGRFAGDSLAVPVLTAVALRRGDLPKAAEYVQRLPALGHYYPSPYLTDGVRLVEAQVLEARCGPHAALDFLADVLAGLPEHRSVLLTDPASAPWLVRVALAAGDREQAARIVTAIGEVARGNPALAFIRASAEHAEGLLTSDVSLLQHASAQLPDPWARACAVEDQGVLLAAAGRDREAIRSLEEALREYGRLGARRGVARTRRRLRQLGVRRQYWASEQRPAAGWASLTDIEQATARLVAEGLTNQRIADQLFISTHTVAFHLRQVFRKLDIRSRVDLARIALEHARPEAAQTP